MARWEAMTPLMRNARENWKCELQRIKKLQFWSEIKNVQGFPTSSTVLHIHPVALVANFQSRRCINVEEFLRIYESEHVSFEAGTRPLDEESKGHLRALLTGIIAAYERYKKTDCKIPYIAYMLATARHETAKYNQSLRKTIYFKPVTEAGATSYFNKYDPILADTAVRRQTAMQNGNTVQGDGYTYRGRGYVQLTWKDNYRKVGCRYGVDLVANPDRALEPEIAAFATVYGMEDGIFTGRKLSNYINDASQDYLNARRIINGLDQAEKIAGYAVKFRSMLERSTQ
jgi:predicted chitinase